ncbi:hypothetical protein D3C78_1923150 [compost metagenome]
MIEIAKLLREPIRNIKKRKGFEPRGIMCTSRIARKVYWAGGAGREVCIRLPMVNL